MGPKRYELLLTDTRTVRFAKFSQTKRRNWQAAIRPDRRVRPQAHLRSGPRARDLSKSATGCNEGRGRRGAQQPPECIIDIRWPLPVAISVCLDRSRENQFVY